MATQKKKELTEQELYEQMLANLSPEDRAAMDQMTGQSNLKGGKKTPVLRVSYKESDDEDLNGKSIKKGNFVIGQKTTYDAKGDEIIEEIGIDFGDEISLVVLAIGNQYSFYSETKGASCSSQITRDRSEVPVGSTLKINCSDGTCPHRQDGIDRKDRCSNQFVLFVKLPEGTKLPDGTDCPVALLYVKGTSYMPCKDYFAGNGEFALRVNSLMCFTVIKTTRMKKGSVTFFDLSFKQGPLDPSGFKESHAIATEVVKELEAFKAQNATAPAIAAPSGPGQAMIEGPTAGADAKPGGDDNFNW